MLSGDTAQFICVETSLITPATTMNFEFIYPWIKILRPIAQSSDSASSPPSQFSARSIITMFGYNFQ
jgi:hypothetical protein